MNDRRFRAALLLAVVLGAGCARFTGAPQLLLEQGEDALNAKSLDDAYARFVELRRRYPDSPECREAFPYAAAVVKRRYLEDRYKPPASIWLTQEPQFMFAWLGSYVTDDTFPQREAQALFRGMPGTFFRSYVEFAKSDPVLSGWTLHETDDDGIISSVSAVR